MFVSLLYLTFLLVLGVSPYLLCEKSHLNTLVTLGGTDLASWNLSINGSAFEIPFIADFHAEILVDDENRLYENWKFLVKNDNIEVLVRVLNQLEDKIRKGDFGHTEKMLISCVATVVTQASQSLALAEEMFRQGLVAQLIKTVFHFEFLNDTNLSSDLLVSGLNLIRNSFRKEISFEVKQKLEQLLEPFWPAINNLFHAESSPLVKLMIGNLMVRKKELLPNILTIQKTELLSLRDSIFPSSSDQQDAFHHSMKTKFFGFETVMVDRGEVQNLFNTFLASEENRKVLCNRRTFEDFFLAVNKIAANAKADAGKIKRLQKWATASLRGLYVEIITCVAFRPFFQDFHVKMLRAIIEGIDGENFPEVTSSAILLSRSAIARKHYCKAEDIRFERDRFGLKYICNMMSEKGTYDDILFTVDSVIATIAEPDFSSKAGLSDLDELLSVVRTKGDADTFINLFVKKNGPEILQSWLKNFLNISEEKHDYVKSYCGRLLNFICFGCYYAKFVHYIFDTSILADYVRFTFSPILFNDSSFTGQVLQVALLTMHKIQVRTVGNTMQQMFTKYFGDDLSILENRLKSETASFPKLLFKTLLIQNLTDLNSIDSDWLSLSCSDIKNLSALIFSENVNYKIDFRSYFNFVIELPVYWIQREFNKLLSAETNRQCLCRRGIFDFFFNGIFSLPMTTKYFNPYPYLEVVIPCLRRLVIIAQSCVQYSQYFNRTHSKKLDTFLDPRSPLATNPQLRETVELIKRRLQRHVRCENLVFSFDDFGIKTECHNYTHATIASYLVEDFTSTIRAVISFMSVVKFTNDMKEMDFFMEDFEAQMSVGTDSEKLARWELFEKFGGINAISSWLKKFAKQAITEESAHIHKRYGSLIVPLIHAASQYPSVFEKICTEGIYNELLHLTFAMTLMNDTDFHHGFSLWALFIVTELSNVHPSSSWPFNITEAFFEGDSVKIVENRFKDSPIPLKILIGGLFAQRNAININASDFERLNIHEDAIAEFTFHYRLTDFHYKFLSNNFYWRDLWIRPDFAQQCINALLLVESNGRHLCRKRSFEYLLQPIQSLLMLKDPGESNNIFAHWCTVSLRGLFLVFNICHNLTNFSEVEGKNVVEMMGKIINNNKLIPYTDAQAEAGILRDSINHPSMFCQNVELKLERDQFGIKGRCPRLTIEPLEKSYEKSSVNEFVADSKRDTIVIVLSVLGVAVFLATAVYLWRNRKNKNTNNANSKSAPSEPFSPNRKLYKPVETVELTEKLARIPIADIPLEGVNVRTLGTGAHGIVKETRIKFGHFILPVAVKLLRDVSQENVMNLKAEQDIMQMMGWHVNVCRLLAVIDEYKYYEPLVLEYCGEGSLYSLLPNLLMEARNDTYIPEKARGNNFLIREAHLDAFAFQIADGMAYLSKQQLYHRDLAARNILVNSRFVIKIADFGLTRWGDRQYNATSDSPMPLEVAPEGISLNIYSEKSDVFSFGILLMCLYNLSVEKVGDTIQKAKSNPKQLVRPVHARHKIFKLIIRVMHKTVTYRPGFDVCKNVFKTYLPKKFFMEMTTALEQDTKDFSDAQDKFKSFNLQPISSQ